MRKPIIGIVAGVGGVAAALVAAVIAGLAGTAAADRDRWARAGWTPDPPGTTGAGPSRSRAR
jgi:hypothetical protein